MDFKTPCVPKWLWKVFNHLKVTFTTWLAASQLFEASSKSMLLSCHPHCWPPLPANAVPRPGALAWPPRDSQRHPRFSFYWSHRFILFHLSYFIFVFPHQIILRVHRRCIVLPQMNNIVCTFLAKLFCFAMSSHFQPSTCVQPDPRGTDFFFSSYWGLDKRGERGIRMCRIQGKLLHMRPSCLWRRVLHITQHFFGRLPLWQSE